MKKPSVFNLGADIFECFRNNEGSDEEEESYEKR